MKRIIHAIVFLIFILADLTAQQKYIDWELIPSPDFSAIEIIDANSTEDFWAFDKIGFIHHFIKNEWTSYTIPHNTSFTRYKFLRLNSGKVLISAVDSVWRSHIYLFDSIGITNISVLDNAVNNILKLYDDRIFLVGDWGNVWEYKNEEFIKLNTPFSNHILSSVSAKHNLWLGVRGEGMFSFDGKKFRQFEIEDGNQIEIISLGFSKDSSLVLLSGNRQIYILTDSVFSKALKSPPAAMTIRYDNDFSYYKINPDLLPFGNSGINIPAIHGYLQHKQFPGGDILLVTNENKIYKSKVVHNNYFNDYAMFYRIKGYENYSNFGAAFIYYNDDLLPDLFIRNNFSELFLNKPNSPFTNFSGQSNIPNLGGSEDVLFADVSNDGLIDIVHSDFLADGPVIKVGIQDHNGTFNEEIKISSNYVLNQRAFKNINIADFNADGLLDLDIALYLGENLEAGNQLLVFNEDYGEFGNPDASFRTITKGWNIQSIVADFNNDDMNDWLIISRWKPIKLLICKNANKLVFEELTLPGDTLNSFVGGLAADFNNDGFLDIAVSSDKKLLSILINKNGINFYDFSDSLGLRDLNKIHYSRTLLRSMNCGDINNDGFLDIFMSIDDPLNPRNLLFINHNGNKFIESSQDYKIDKPFIRGSVLADVDTDGDIDIFGFRDGYNSLWINNLNDSNYISIIPRGVKSNTDAIGSKVEVYMSGYLGDSERLVADRQLGSDRYGSNQQNQIIAHFGLSDTNEYDIRVKFYAGKTVDLLNVKTGQTILVNELDGWHALIYTLPRQLIIFALTTENQIYLIIVLLSFISIYFGTRYGTAKFKWEYSTTILIVVVDISLFWIFIFFTHSSGSIILQYLLPLLISILGILLPLIIFATLKRNSIFKKSREELEEDLLYEILQFSHGEWALRNISGLLFLCENYPTENERLKKYLEMYYERAGTFNNLTKPILLKIIEISKLLRIANEPADSLASHIIQVNNFFDENRLNKLEQAEIKKLGVILNKIKNEIKSIKQFIYKFFSCQPEFIIKSISTEYTDNENVEIKRYKNYETERPALIRGQELGVILDNILQNSIRASSNTESPLIEFNLNWEAPRIIIEVKDNGCGIEKEKWEVIFQQGYSENRSTGTGLAASKNILKKYNGTIYIKESCPGKGTTIRLELNEGIK